MCLCWCFGILDYHDEDRDDDDDDGGDEDTLLLLNVFCLSALQATTPDIINADPTEKK